MTEEPVSSSTPLWHRFGQKALCVLLAVTLACWTPLTAAFAQSQRTWQTPSSSEDELTQPTNPSEDDDFESIISATEPSLVLDDKTTGLGDGPSATEGEASGEETTGSADEASDAETTGGSGSSEDLAWSDDADETDMVTVHYVDEYIPNPEFAESPEDAEPVVYHEEYVEETFTCYGDEEGIREGYISVDEAMLTVAQAMVDRQTTIQVNYYLPAGSASTDYSPKVIIYGAMDIDTLGPASGDYNRWSYAGMSSSSSVATDPETGIVYRKATLTVKYYTTLAQEQQLQADVQEVLASLNLSGTKYQQVLAIYKYITTNVDYDYDNPDTYTLKYTAYAALENGTAVCQGYSTLFYLMCRYQGIDVRVITGYANNSSHAWNIVQMDDGMYYNLDSTWDETRTQSTWKYFLKCDANFTDHQRYGANGATPPNSNITDYTTDAFYDRYPIGPADYSSASVSAGWVKIDGLWYYRNADGTYKRDCLAEINSYTYYFQPDGSMTTGWQKWSNGTWSYFDESEKPIGHMVYGWKKIDGKWYWFDSNGIMYKGRIKINGYWYCLGNGGAMVTSGWYKMNGYWSYSLTSSPSGHLATGWLKVDDLWYWFDSSGIMATGWRQINSKWYLFRPGGSMVTGWYEWSDGTWSKCDTNGVAITGWIKSGNYWYYADPDTRKTITGWRTIGNYTFYFYSNGKMATGKVTIDGVTYDFGTNGRLVA